ncbi:MAG: DUF5916 domain-containing protein [bacterium]|nr:DUF5916 domain-containing protein [bacterium]
MTLLLFLSLSLGSVSIPKVGVAPVIDGKIDSVWGYADSVSEFVQIDPDEGEAASELTKVFICRDDKNIYIAFKCFDVEPLSLNVKKVPRDYFDNEDNVAILFDTFGDKTTAYEFMLNAAGVQYDEKLSEDGRAGDVSWDGVWYSSVKVTDYGYVAEIKIPFKTLRFKKGMDEWGVNFFRYISRNNESVTWAPLKQVEGIRVSRCGVLKGIPNTRQGLNLEVYPVGLVRYESWKTLEDRDVLTCHPQAGLDVGWGFTSSQLSLTVLPDFAQIEADPGTINLSEYEPYLDERRPFFIESREVFAAPITLFYSRRIGKKLPEGEVPILGGAKYTGALGRVKFGMLSAYTDSISPGEDWFEPRNLYSVGRVKMGVLKNSDIGFTYSGVSGDSSFNNQKAIGIDGMFRTRELQLATQVAKSDSGYAEEIALNWYARKFLVLAGYENYDTSFDVGEIGFAPYVGYKIYSLMAGPQFFNKGPFRKFVACAGAGGTKKAGNPSGNWISVRASPFFKNNYGGTVNVYKGKGYEMNREYDYSRLHVSLYTDSRKAFVLYEDMWYKSFGFNYRRKYFASTATNDLIADLKVNPSLSFLLDLSNTFEWRPSGDMEQISWILRPTMQYALTKDMQLRIYAEPNTDTHIHQFNALLSYNFRPKSWVFLAFNQTIDNVEDDMDMTDRVVVTKVRYLFFW